jgi:A/G-specific adenine glycosylase
LLDWYDRHARQLPWRVRGGVRPDPYRVWLSEIMLQQTTVATVTGYFEDFLRRWPAVADLAAASLDDILHAWQGLGYYARARNLHKCAKVVAVDLGGRFPDTEDALQALPGIGPYTAAAIAAIAFGRPATPVDGNVERVMARMFAVEEPLPHAKPALKILAAGLTPTLRPGDYAQAVMDLGATVCVPRSPRCDRCPWQERCIAYRNGNAPGLPRRVKKPPRPTKFGTVFWLETMDGQVLLQRRPERGLLGGLMEFPSNEWREAQREPESLLQDAPMIEMIDQWRVLPGHIRHVFTHFALELTVATARINQPVPPEDTASAWAAVDSLGDYALPTLMKKVARHVASFAAVSRKWNDRM